MIKTLLTKYYFSVEGETEELYLKHLERLLREAGCNVSFTVKKGFPDVFLKSFTPLKKSSVYHLFDMESNSEECYIKRFESILNDIAKADDKEVKYFPCYSNLAFEVWIILHKKDFHKSLTNINGYLSIINKIFDKKYKKLKEYKREKDFNAILKNISLKDVNKAVSRAIEIEKTKERNGEKKITFNNKYSYYKNDPYTELGNVVGNILYEWGLRS